MAAASRAVLRVTQGLSEVVARGAMWTRRGSMCMPNRPVGRSATVSSTRRHSVGDSRGLEQRASSHAAVRRVCRGWELALAGPRAAFPYETWLGGRGLVGRRLYSRVEGRGSMLRRDLAGLDLLGEMTGDEMAVELAQGGLVGGATCLLHEGATSVKSAAFGGFAGLGMSPSTRIGARACSVIGSGIGIALSSVIVYGCSGLVVEIVRGRDLDDPARDTSRRSGRRCAARRRDHAR